jgi:hypothetical protein
VIVPPAAIAAQVIQDGGSTTQAWVAAALASGVESNGDPTELAGGTGPAAGLFQYEPGTWISNGGGQYAAVAQDATWQDQVAVFVKQTQGDHFGAWGPDLVANSGNPNDPSNSSYGYTGAPQAGSRVANQIAKLASTGALTAARLGNAPQPDAGGVVPASPTPIPLGNNGVNVGAGVFSGLTGLETGVDDLLGKIDSGAWWKRVGIFALGIGLVVGGIVLFVSTTDTGQEVKSDAAVAAVA